MKHFPYYLSALFVAGAFTSSLAQTQAILDVDGSETTISRHIYGHFSEHLGRCIYDGIWVGEDAGIKNTRGMRTEVVEALKEIGTPNLRWPGGCFADEYHWMDGIGPKADRPPMINTHWGMISEDNSFGTHEFLDLCEMLNCEPIIAGNVGSGTVRELSQWIEYTNADIDSPMSRLRKQNGRDEAWHVRYWNIGNESWGCGGEMSPEQYYDAMVRYSTFMRSYPGKPIYKIAVGPGGSDLSWTERLMKKVAENRKFNSFDGLSMHYYTVPGPSWSDKGSAINFGEQEWFTTMRKAMGIEDLIEQNLAILDKYSPRKKIDLLVDEWGCWHDQEPGSTPGFLYQQNTLRDALVAAMSLNIFNKHADRVKMANIAQVVNVLQAMILTNEEEVVRTPTFYVYKMYKVHHDAQLLPLLVQPPKYTLGDESIPALNASASKDEQGRVHLTIANWDANKPQTFTCTVSGSALRFQRGEVLTADRLSAFNDFGKPEAVNIKSFSAVKVNGQNITVEVPARAVVMVELK